MPAHAEKISPGYDSLTFACASLQNRVGPLVEEYGRDATTGARMEEILAELRNIGNT